MKICKGIFIAFFLVLVMGINIQCAGMPHIIVGENCKDFAANISRDGKLSFFQLQDYDGEFAPSCVEFIKHPSGELWVFFATKQGSIYAAQQNQDVIENCIKNAPMQNIILPEGINGCCANQDNTIIALWNDHHFKIISAQNFFEGINDSDSYAYPHTITQLYAEDLAPDYTIATATLSPDGKNLLFILNDRKKIAILRNIGDADAALQVHRLEAHEHMKDVCFLNNDKAVIFFNHGGANLASIDDLTKTSKIYSSIHIFHHHEIDLRALALVHFGYPGLDHSLLGYAAALENNRVFLIQAFGSGTDENFKFAQDLPNKSIKKFKAFNFDVASSQGGMLFVLQGKSLRILFNDLSDLEQFLKQFPVVQYDTES